MGTPRKPARPARRAGRPSKLTPDVQQAITAALRAGAYLEQAARHAGISVQTVYNWLDRGRSELDRIERAEQHLDQLPKRARKADRLAAQKACEPLADEAGYLGFLEAYTRASADAEIHAVGVLRAAMPEDWRAALAYLERRYPDRWRKRTSIEREQPGDRGRRDEAADAGVEPGSEAAARAAHEFLARLREASES